MSISDANRISYESMLTENRVKLDKNKRDLQGQQVDIIQIKSDGTNRGNDISALKTKRDDFENRISAIESQMVTVLADISLIKTTLGI